jgi:dUTP pyrophosphatase
MTETRKEDKGFGYEVGIHKLTDKAHYPSHATPHSACHDVHACFYTDFIRSNGKGKMPVRSFEDGGSSQIEMFPKDRALVPTGLIFLIPKGYKMGVFPRSGLAFKQGITVVNSPGTIDHDYAFELFVILINVSDIPVVIRDGERIAQIEIIPTIMDRINFIPADIEQVEAFRSLQERKGGVGSTGKS